MTDLLFAGVLTRSPHLVFGGAVAAPPEVLPDDTVSIGRACGCDAAAGMGASLAHVTETAQPASAATLDRWQAAAPIGTAAADLSRSAAPVTHGCADLASGALSHVGQAAMAWQSADRLAGYGRAGYDIAAPVRGATASRWAPAASIGLPCRHAFQAARPAHGVTRPRLRHARPVDAGRVDRQQAAMPPPPGLWLPPPIPPTPPVQHPVNLLFHAAIDHTTQLLFGYIGPGPVRPGAFIPLQAVYLVANSVTLVRADNGQPVPARNLTVGISRDGPHWTWSASIPGSARALIAPNPDPVELIATLNGTAVHVLVESLRRDRRFGEDTIRASGRSRSAWLSAPYAPVVTRGNGSAAMAQQLAADALTVNGVPIGWALDWRVNDWLLPAGTWSHQGTAMEAVARVAEAAGGYLQAHPSALTLRALPHYPVAPWAWGGAVPDVQIPEDVAEQEGAEVLRKADYNAVYVIGQGAGGRRDRILRAGSAGDKVAPQILDPLATDPAMTAPRGLVALADTGLQTLITLRLPVLADTGLILPGQLVQYSAEGASRRGLSRSLQADWSLPELWQTIEIETHG